MKKLAYTLVALILAICAACIAGSPDADADVGVKVLQSQQEEAAQQGPARLAVPPVLWF